MSRLSWLFFISSEQKNVRKDPEELLDAREKLFGVRSRTIGHCGRALRSVIGRFAFLTLDIIDDPIVDFH